MEKKLSMYFSQLLLKRATKNEHNNIGSNIEIMNCYVKICCSVSLPQEVSRMQ